MSTIEIDVIDDEDEIIINIIHIHSGVPKKKKRF